MPVSAEISQTKQQSKSEMLCEQMDASISRVKKDIAAFEQTKQELEYEPGLLKKAIGMKLGSKEDTKQVMDEMKAWKDEVKSDVKAAVNQKKQELKLERKTRRKNIQGAQVPETKAPVRKKKKRGGFI